MIQTLTNDIIMNKIKKIFFLFSLFILTFISESKLSALRFFLLSNSSMFTDNDIDKYKYKD